MKNIDLNKHISDLLFLHDFVTIPDFGSFVTNYKPAVITENGIYPPSKAISFNSVLKTDDGLLTSYISEIYNIDYKESKKKISAFVRDIYLDLDNKKQVAFENIGSFEFDKKLNLIFEPNLKLNFLSDSFGFSTVHYPTIEHSASKLEKTFKDRSKLKKSLTSSTAKILYIALPILIFVSIITTQTNIFDKSNYNYTNIGDIINILDSNNNKSIIEKKLDSMTKKENALMYVENLKPVNSENIFETQKEIEQEKNELKNKKTIETIEVVEENKKTITENKTTKEKEKDNKKTTITKETKGNYILVAGSFSNLKNAERFVKKLKKKDISGEIINHKGKYRVSASSFNSKKEAKAESKRLKKSGIKTWVSTR